MNAQEILQTLSDGFASSASVKNVYGDPVTAGARTVIPVAEVRYTFGAGGGSHKDKTESGGGGGGRVTAQPVGALEVTPEGSRFIPFQDPRKFAAAVALGFSVGVLVSALTSKKRVEIVKRP